MSLTEQQIPSGLDLLSLCVSRAMEDKAVHMTNLLSVFCLFIQHGHWQLNVLFCCFGFLDFFVLFFFKGKKSSKRKKSDHVGKLEEYLLSSCELFARRYLGLENQSF